MTETTSRVRLLIVDDHALMRMGLRSLFSTEPGIAVVGEAGTVADAVREARRLRPEVVLLDVRLPDGSGVDACREIRAEAAAPAVLMLTSYDDEEALFASILAGASGYVLKHINPERLIEAVQVVARGDSLLDPTVTGKALARMRALATRPAAEPLDALNEQQQRMLPLLAQGKTNREIAAALFLSEHTVKSYVSEILAKLNLHRRAEAAAFFAQHQHPAGP